MDTLDVVLLVLGALGAAAPVVYKRRKRNSRLAEARKKAGR